MMRLRPATRSRLGRAASRMVRDGRGVTAIEFGVIAPVFLTLLFGILDMGHMVYAQSVLNGAVQDAARNAALEIADTAAADAMVSERVLPVVPNATVASTRRSYFDFADIGRAEDWNDSNNNGTCDHNESYVDENGNGDWDEDIGVSGNGGANDVVVYTVTVTYDPVFKVPFIPDTWNTRRISSTAVRKNQPFAQQADYGSTARNCT